MDSAMIMKELVIRTFELDKGKLSWIRPYFGELIDKNNDEAAIYNYCKICFLINYDGATLFLNNFTL